MSANITRRNVLKASVATVRRRNRTMSINKGKPQGKKRGEFSLEDSDRTRTRIVGRRFHR
jgi:hypothetical protein